jgi:hypothetical protein
MRRSTVKAAIWNIDVDGSTHEVRLEWTYWGGQRDVYVDGVPVEGDTVPFRWSSTQPVDVGSKRVAVITRPRKINKAAFDVFLEVDGEELAPTGDASDDGSSVPSS